MQIFLFGTLIIFSLLASYGLIVGVFIFNALWFAKDDPGMGKGSWVKTAHGFKRHLKGCTVEGMCPVDSRLHRWIEHRQWKIITRRRRHFSATFLVLLTVYLRILFNAFLIFIPGIRDITINELSSDSAQ